MGNSETIKKARAYKHRMIDEHPDNVMEIVELFSLMMTNVSNGSDVDYEFEAFVKSTNKLFND